MQSRNRISLIGLMGTMMMMMMMSVLLLLSTMMPSSEAFQVNHHHQVTNTKSMARGKYQNVFPTQTLMDSLKESSSSSTSSTCLNLFNKKKEAPPPPPPATPKEEKIKMDWDFNLFLLYMTPWKNPNSIFLYFFIILYCLGKYSEAKSMSGGAL